MKIRLKSENSGIARYQSKSFKKWLDEIEENLERYAKGDIRLIMQENDLYIDFYINRKITYRAFYPKIFHDWANDVKPREIADGVICNYFDYIYSQYFKKDFIEKT